MISSIIPEARLVALHAKVDALRMSYTYTQADVRAVELEIERLFNQSSVHDDHLDRHPDAAKSYLSSLDAVMALVDEFLPDCGVNFHAGPVYGASVGLHKRTPTYAQGPNRAWALMLAMMDEIILRFATGFWR